MIKGLVNSTMLKRADYLRFPGTVTNIVLPHRAWENLVGLTLPCDSIDESSSYVQLGL